MAIKIRCKECRKKISMDEAFAGGMCRCPYCRATNVVPGERRSGRDDRPDRPDRPDSPQTPATADARRTIPLAKPVKVQGILSLILLALLFLLSAFVAVYGMKMVKDRQRDAAPPPPVNPIIGVKGVQIAGLPMRTPVVYVIDAAGSMRDFYDPAAVLVRH